MTPDRSPVDERLKPLVNALKFEVTVNCTFAELSILSPEQLGAFMAGIGLIAAANNIEKWQEGAR